MPASDEPKLSEFLSEGPFVVVSFISTVFFTVPSAFMSMTCTAPLLSSPASSRSSPTAISGIPSLLRSPIPATDEPKLSKVCCTGPFSVEWSILTVLFTVPFAFMSIMCTAPN